MANELHPSEVKLLLDNNEEHEIASKTVSALHLFRYVQRSANDPADFVIERTIRQNEGFRAMYFDMIGKHAIAASEFAAAASSEKFPERDIGDYRLSALEDDGDFFVVLKKQKHHGDGTWPRFIEFRLPDGRGQRRQLPNPTRSQQLIALNKEREEDQALLEMLSDASLRLFLQ